MSNHHFLYPFFLILGLTGTMATTPSVVQPVSIDYKVLAANPYKEETNTAIPWMTDRRLAWDDFLGHPQRNTDAVASTSTSLGVSYRVDEGALVYTITCDFSKIKSWGSLKTDYILAHEQGHFDITELFARRLHEALLQYTFNRKTYKQDINAIYQKIVREKEEMQHAYDSESDHSRKRKLQFEWEEKIELLLKDSEAFANYP
jgi:hypothetical protein